MGEIEAMRTAIQLVCLVAKRRRSFFAQPLIFCCTLIEGQTPKEGKKHRLFTTRANSVAFVLRATTGAATTAIAIAIAATAASTEPVAVATTSAPTYANVTRAAGINFVVFIRPRSACLRARGGIGGLRVVTSDATIAARIHSGPWLIRFDVIRVTGV
ncbi:MAG: hypothetical protein QNJ03_06820 [Dinoroseobacter sp.]|nr:hypothetical protein [Dinoroseobacter sp.]